MPSDITAKELRGKNPPKVSENLEISSSYTFWIYTSIGNLNDILKSGYFFASNLAIMNDKNEKELHPNNSESVHALCFCNSNTEKIPMWYLYGGITGKGCALGVTPAKMRDWIRMIKEVYVVVEEDGEEKTEIPNRHYPLEKTSLWNVAGCFIERENLRFSIEINGIVLQKRTMTNLKTTTSL